MAQTAIATHTQCQQFAPTLEVDQSTIESLLARAHVWSQAAIADVLQSDIVEERVQDAECQYVLCLLKQSSTGLETTKGSLKRKEIGHAEEEYYEVKASNSTRQGIKDCLAEAWQFLYLAGLEKPSFCVGVVR